MKEHQRLRKLFKDHFNGDPWIDVQVWASLKGLTAGDAAKNLHGLNSIWQIVHHMACWRAAVLARVQGDKTPSPADNFFIEITDRSARAWAATLQQLKATQKNYLLYLSKELTAPDEKPVPGTYTSYELLQGILQHDAYHLGQILLIRKMLRLNSAE